jgi:PAS domain S-box-containing protein
MVPSLTKSLSSNPESMSETTTMCLSRDELLSEIAKQLPEFMSCEELEKGLTVRLELAKCPKAAQCVQIQLLRETTSSPGDTNTTTSTIDKPHLQRNTSSCTLDEPGSVNSMTGELHYRELFEKMKMAAALHEVIIENGKVVDTRFKEVNSVFCAYFGLEKDQVVGHRLTEVFPGVESDHVPWIEKFGQAGVEGKTFEFNDYAEHLGRWYTGVAYRPDPSRTDLCCVFIDNSKDVVIQEDLRESEERHRNLFECMVQGVVYQDEDGQIIIANPAAEKILGLTLDQMKGRQSIDPRWKAVREDGSDFPGEEHPAMVALRTGKEQMNVIMGVYHPVEDTYHWIKVDAIPRFHRKCTTPFQVCVTFTDITEEKRASEAMLEAKIKAQRADSLKSAFLANMSHEIR